MSEVPQPVKDLTRERLKVTAIGMAAFLVASIMRAALFEYVGTGIPFLTFMPAVLLAALWGGTRAGTIATIGCAALAPIWMTPTGWSGFNAVAWFNLGFFILVCLLMIWAVRQGHWAKMESIQLGERLEETETRLRAVADNIPQLAWMARPDGHLFWYNRRWFEFTGTTAEEMDGWGWRRVHDPERLAGVVASWKKALESERPWEDTFPLRRADGVFRWFLSRALPLRDASGKVTVWFGSNTDVTEQRESAEERRRLLDSERAARSNAERASALKDEFLATLSHELRTPLNAILGWTQLLRSGGNEAEEVREGLETIERNARAQTRIIEDLLEMSRIISGKTRLDIQAVDLSGVVEAAIAAIAPAAAAKEIEMSRELEPIRTISGDPARLQQVLWNLLANAIKFTPKGGRVRIALRQVESHVELLVNDSGEGIAPEFLPFVFDRFRQQDASSTRRHGGLGLGLSIVKNLVELHGGSVVVQSEGRGRGATFTVSLPLLPLRPDDVSQEFPAATASDHHCLGAVELEGVRVLVIDDERDSLDLVRRLLIECQADVLLANSAEEGLRLIEEEKPNVVVSDIGMPGKDGLEMMRELRAGTGERARTPAIALTAFARSEDRTRAMLAGYQVHLSKPVEASELIAAVASLSGRTGSSSDNGQSS